MKRALATLLSICAAFSLVLAFAATAWAAEDETRLAEKGGALLSGTYCLTGDTRLQNDLLIPAGEHVTIDLCGHTLKGTGKGSVIQVGTESHPDATLTIVDSCADAGGTCGCITGGRDANDGGALVVYGTCTMESGMLAGNSAPYGGAVSVYAGACFTLRGGAICNNMAKYGGGVYLSEAGATFIMEGGELRENVAGVMGGAINANKFSRTAISGGKICSNAAAYGGSAIYEAYNADELLISGGEISGNDGCAIEANADISIYGTAAITGNGVGVRASHAISLGGSAVINSNSTDDLLLYGNLTSLTIMQGADAPVVLPNAEASSDIFKIGLTVSSQTRPLTLTNDYAGSLVDNITLQSGQGCLREASGEGGTNHLVLLGEFAISLNANQHGSCESKVYVVQGDYLATPAITADDGWGFQGWYDDKDCTVPHDFSQPVTSGFSLYAKWCELETKTIEVTVSASEIYPGVSYSTQFNWSPRLYAMADSGYDAQIALAALLTVIDTDPNALVQPADAAAGSESDNSTLLAAMGFGDIAKIDVTPRSTNPNNTTEDLNDITGITLAWQQIEGTTEAVLNLSVDGTTIVTDSSSAATKERSAQEWESNMDVGSSDEQYGTHAEWTDESNHKGFDVAANRAISELESYVDEHLAGKGITKVHVMINGYSRGAAIANIIGAKAQQGSALSAIFSDNGMDTTFRTYTFATPNTTDLATDGLKPESYRGIYNVVSDEDVVPTIPPEGMGMTQYGTTIHHSIRGTALETEYLGILGTGYYQKSGYYAANVTALLNNLCVSRADMYAFLDEYTVTRSIGKSKASAENAAAKYRLTFDGSGRAGLYDMDSEGMGAVYDEAQGIWVVKYRINQAFILATMSLLMDELGDGTGMSNLLSMLEYVNQVTCSKTGNIAATLISLDMQSVENAHYPLPYLLAVQEDAFAHTCAGVTYTKRISSAGGTLSSGNYSLGNDIALTGDLIVPAGAEVNLCLKNHNLSFAQSGSLEASLAEATGGIIVESGATLTISACKSGTLNGEPLLVSGGSGIAVAEGGTLTISDSTIGKQVSPEAAELRITEGVRPAGTHAEYSEEGGEENPSEKDKNAESSEEAAVATPNGNGLSATGDSTAPLFAGASAAIAALALAGAVRAFRARQRKGA